MNLRFFLFSGLWTMLFLPGAMAQPGKPEAQFGQANLLPITQVKSLHLKNQKEGVNGFPRAIILQSEKDAKNVLDQEGAEYFQGKVDFDKQMVVVFVWAGSGMDKLKYEVAESFPEQVRFKFERGMTRDHVRHVLPFILRKNVRWKMDLPWNWVKEEIKSGRVESVFQNHKKKVTLQMKGGYQLETVEPALDDIIKLVRESGKDIPIATE